MFRKLLSKALLPLIMDKGARRKLEKTRQAKAAAKATEAADEPQSIEDLEDELVESGTMLAEPPTPGRKAKRQQTSDRQELIEKALAVRRSKMEALGELTREQRERLQVVAMKTLIDKDFGDKKKEK